MSETKSIPHGKTWTKGKIAVEGWDSDDGNFRIIPHKRGGFLLIAFEHDDPSGSGEFWTRQFPTVDDAMDYAERM